MGGRADNQQILRNRGHNSRKGRKMKHHGCILEVRKRRYGTSNLCGPEAAIINVEKIHH